MTKDKCRMSNENRNPNTKQQGATRRRVRSFLSRHFLTFEIPAFRCLFPNQRRENLARVFPRQLPPVRFGVLPMFLGSGLFVAKRLASHLDVNIPYFSVQTITYITSEAVVLIHYLFQRL